MKKDLLKIIEHFGVNNQQRKLNEEVFELNEAITKHENKNPIVIAIDNLNKVASSLNNKNYKISSIEHITEEIADIMVILEEIQYFYGINLEDIRKTMENKVERTLERIESGYYDGKK